MSEQRLGILGGMGPQATQDFYQRILDRTDASCDQEHLPALILSDTGVPDRTASYYFSYVFAGFLSVIRQWLDEKCPETPEELADILFTVMPLYSEEVFRENFR